MVTDHPDPLRSELDGLAPLAVAGDPQALTRLYELTADMLVGVALGMVGDRRLAEDIVQDAFVAFVRTSSSIRTSDGPTIRAWLVTAVRHGCVDHHRRAATRYERASDEVPDAPSEEIADQDAGDLVVRDPVLVEALATLTPDQRDALILFHVAGLSGQEIAAAMTRRRSAVYRLLRRGEENMRQALAGSDVGGSFRPPGERKSREPFE